MSYQSYQLWDTARAKTTCEQRAADERLGKLAAAISGSFSQAPPHGARRGGPAIRARTFCSASRCRCRCGSM